MDAALGLQENCSEFNIIDKAKEYAAAKIAYYEAAWAAKPSLLELAKGGTIDNPAAKEVTEIFKGCGEDQDAQADAALRAALDKCEQSDDATQAKAELARTRAVAEQL